MQSLREFHTMDISREIIEGHRQLIFERYDFDRVEQLVELPPSFTRLQADELRHFFMDYVYPDSEKRAALNAAFDQMDIYLKNPGRVLRILADSIGIAMKYGRHLPKLIQSAIRAFDSFRSASLIEDLLMEKALDQKLNPPYSTEQIKRLMSMLDNSVKQG